MEQTSWLLSKNEKNPLSLYEEYKKNEKKKERRWKIISLISSGGFIFSMILTLYALSLPKTVPLVIAVSDIGEAKNVGDISKYSYDGIKVSKKSYEFYLKLFINNAFSIPGDFAILKKNINSVYHYLDSNAANKFNIFIQENDPRKSFGKKIVTVDFISILKQSDKTYQVDFIITATQKNGQIKSKTKMRALVTTELMHPSSSDIDENPLGIYFTNFDFTVIGAEDEYK